MTTTIQVIPIIAREEGRTEGRKLGPRRLRQTVRKLLAGAYLRDTLGAMSRHALETYVRDRMETAPDYGRYPELEDLYPERLDFLRGLAEGAECTPIEAALWSYLTFRQEIETWYRALNDGTNPTGGVTAGGHCSGVMMVGPDGVIGGQSAESLPLVPRPKAYRWKAPPAVVPWRALKARKNVPLILRKPRTGYIAAWGVGNEKGVTGFCANSCSVWLDEPIEDTWPIGPVPLLRFATHLDHLIELYTRYTLHNWGRASQIWADASGQGAVIEKSFRRIGVRRMGPEGVLWCTEGHWESPVMADFIGRKRRDYLARMGKHLGAGDMQYATDCAVRFTRLGELCHLPLGRTEKHLSRVLTDHAPFPRAVCRHGGPDTAPYDQSVTQLSFFANLTRNRTYTREWIPWKKFPCERPWTVTPYPPRPGA